MKLTLPLRAVYGPACGDKPWEPCQAHRCSAHIRRRDRLFAAITRKKTNITVTQEIWRV
jgi:hypothetical protein